MVGSPALSHLYHGVYLFALPTDQRKPEILQLDLFVGPGEGGVEEASPRHQSPSPLGATLRTQTPKKGHIPPAPSLAQPPASTMLWPGTDCVAMGTGPALSEVLPAGHVLVPVQHPLAQLLGLNSAGELEVGEFTTQQLWFQEALGSGVARQSRGPEGFRLTARPGVYMILTMADP